jgi:hypothetical protein
MQGAMKLNIGSNLFCGAFPPIRVFWGIGRVATPVEYHLLAMSLTRISIDFAEDYKVNV